MTAAGLHKLYGSPGAPMPKCDLNYIAYQVGLDPDTLAPILEQAVAVMFAEDLTPDEMEQALRNWRAAALKEWMESA